MALTNHQKMQLIEAIMQDDLPLLEERIAFYKPFYKPQMVYLTDEEVLAHAASINLAEMAKVRNYGAGGYIDAIKDYRQRTGAGLWLAKTVIDKYRDEYKAR